MKKPKTTLIFLSLIVLILVFSIFLVYMLLIRNTSNENSQSNNQNLSINEAIDAGKRLSNDNCRDDGSVDLTHLPMNEEDFSHIEPYGVMVGAHVTPVDHWYFAPTDFNSPRDTYPVYAIADGTITDISRRSINVDTGESRAEEFRLVFTYSCTFFTYYDLVTSLSPEILAQAKDLEKKDYASTNIKVRAGDIIGYIGGQTLDFAVWDTTKPLEGFVSPELYEGEFWKLYTANPYEYFTDELNAILIEKNIRKVEPIQGKIDYDIDGKLVGNWFKEGTNGYAGTNQQKYWDGHLSVVYDYIVPTGIVVSVGDFGGETKQFSVVGNSPDPASIGVESGLVKYELSQIGYVDENGVDVNFNFSSFNSVELKPQSQVLGVILFELLEDRKLKVEAFPNKTATEVTGFTQNALIYVR